MTSPARDAPLACLDCSAYGGIAIRESMYSPEKERECPTCEGSGVRRCQLCGEGEAVGLTRDNDAACFVCWQIDRREGETGAGRPDPAPAFGGGMEEGSAGPRQHVASSASAMHGKSRDSLPLSPFATAVTKTLAAVAHKDAEPSAKGARHRYGRGLRTHYTYQKEGAPEVRAVLDFLRKSAWPTRHAASILAAAHQYELDGETETAVVRLYHEALAHQKKAEAQDTCLDICRETGWLEKAKATERDMAWDAVTAACERWFASHRTPPERVWS